MKRTTVLLLSLVVGACTSFAGQTKQYKFIDLGTLPNGSWSRASAINNAGQLVGTCEAGTTSHACFWFKGKIHD